jgi:hypothetical protein
MQVRTEDPYHLNLPDLNLDWSRSDFWELIKSSPQDTTPPLGKPMILTQTVDVNLLYDEVTGSSETNILLMIINSSIEWFS